MLCHRPRWTVLHLVQAFLKLDWRTPIHNILRAFLFSQNWSLHGGQGRELLCLPISQLWGPVGLLVFLLVLTPFFGFGESCFFIKLPGIFYSLCERWSLCYICLMGHFVLILVLAVCAVAPVIAVSSTLSIKRMSQIGWKMAVWYGLWDGFRCSVLCSAHGIISFSSF